jgi:hypothetical protein
MRITIQIDDQLLVEAKTRAAMAGRTLSQVVEDALREAFTRRGGRADSSPLPVFSGGRLMPDVDLDHGAALLEVLDAN